MQTLEKGDTDFGPVQSWSFLAYLLKYICLSLDFQSGQNEECVEEDKSAEITGRENGKKNKLVFSTWNGNKTDKGFEREIFDRFTTIHQKKYVH